MAPPESEISLRAIIRDFLDEFENGNLLPAENSTRRDKMACRQIYGMICRFFKNALYSNNPIADYKQMMTLLEGSQDTLRSRLRALMPPNKTLPEQVVTCLDDLSGALDLLMSMEKEEIIAMHESEKAEAGQKEETAGEPKREKRLPVQLVPIIRVRNVAHLLKEEREKMKKLTEENNRLALELRSAKMEIDQWRGGLT